VAADQCLSTLTEMTMRPGDRSTVSDAQALELVGIVTETLPSALYRVRLDQGSVVTAHVAGRFDRNFVRILVGDRVRLELSPIDIGRGRIVGKI
jgi:translation initiation factor IF-1